MNGSRIVVAFLVLTALGAGVVAADHVAVSWEEYPDSTVDPDDPISVEADVTTNEEAEVRLKQDRGLRSDRTLDSWTVYSDGTVSLSANAGDLELDPGESTDLYLEVVEVDSPIWRSGHDDTSFSSSVTIRDDPPEITDKSIDTDNRQMTVTAEIDEGVGDLNTAELNWKTGSTWSFSGESADMTHTGGGTYEYTIPESGRFDWDESVDIYVEVTDEFGESVETDTETEQIPDNSPPSIDSWSRTVNDDRTVTVEATVTDGEVGVDDVDLVYSTSLLGSETVTMSYAGGYTYEVTIPTSDAFEWGTDVDLRVEATDFEGETADTSTRTETIPDNSPPSIDSWSVEENDDRTVTVEATVSDDEAGVDEVEVEWKTGSTWSFSGESVEMTNTGGDSYEYTIPASGVFDWGESVDVRIEATDTASETTQTTAREATVSENTPPDIRWIDVAYDNTEVIVSAEVTDDETELDSVVLHWDTGSLLPWSGETIEMSPTGDDEYEATFDLDAFGEMFTYGVTATDMEGAERESPDFEGEVPRGTAAVDITNGLSHSQDVTVMVDGEERTTITVPADAPETEHLTVDPGDRTFTIEYISEERGGETVTDEQTATIDQGEETPVAFSLQPGDADGEFGTYLSPEEGDVYELDKWYDVDLEVINTGDVVQTFEVEAHEPSGTEVEDPTQQITLDPSEVRTVTFEQQLYGVNTETRAFSHDLYLIDEDGERSKIDSKNVTLQQPDVATLELEFVDEDGVSVDASFELYDDESEFVRDGRGDRRYQFFEAGEYELIADADGHHETVETLEVLEDEEQTVTVTVPSEATDAAINAPAVVDEQSSYVTGDTVTVEADVTNTGEEEHTFFVGFSMLGPDGEFYDNDETTGTSITLAPGATEQVELTWTVEGTAPDGSYDAYVATYWESDIDALATELDMAVEEDAIVVGETDSEDLSIVADHTDPYVGSKVALTVDDPDPTMDYEWHVVESPSTGTAELLHETGSHTSLTATEEGTYTVRISAESPDRSITTDEVLIDADERYFDQLDADAMELAEQYAPVINFHADEGFFPTRYEGYVEESDVVVDPIAQRSIRGGTVIEDATLNDLDPDRHPHSETSFIDPGTLDDGEMREIQDLDTYPPTVYTSFHNITIDSNDYVAVGYWLFYVHDPKPDNTDVDSIAKHTGDQEPVFVLLNESGPQWIAAQQHKGGELREFEQVGRQGTHPNVFPAQGAHSNFLEPYAGAPDGGFLDDGAEYPATYLYQKQFREMDLTSTDPHWTAPSYYDPTGDDEVWAFKDADPEVSTHEDYDLIQLTERMSWTDFMGSVYKYPSETEIAKGRMGNLPTQQDRWDNLDHWIESNMAPSHEQFDVEFAEPTDGSAYPISIDDDGMVVVETEVKNTGMSADEFVLDVTAEHESSTTHTEEYGIFVDTGDALTRTHRWTDPQIDPEVNTAQIPVFPDEAGAVQSGEWDVSVELHSYTDNIRTDDDQHDKITFPYDHEAGASADVEFIDTPTGDVRPGDEVTSEVRVTNTGDSEQTFFVGYSAIDVAGSERHNDNETGTPVTLAPDTSERIELTWSVEPHMPEGPTDLVTAVWLEANRDDLQTRLDSDRVDDAVTVSDTDIGELTVVTDPPGATVLIDGDEQDLTTPTTLELEEGEYGVTVDTSDHEAETDTVEIVAGTETIVEFDLEQAPQDPSASVMALPTAPTVGEPVEFDASGSTDPLGLELSYEWDLTGDGEFDDATGPVVDHTFEEPGEYEVTVRVDNGDLTDTGTTVISVSEADVDELVVTSTPDNATVYIDGDRVGTTPWSDDRPVEDTYEVEVAKEGYVVETRTGVSPPESIAIDLDEADIFNVEITDTNSPVEAGETLEVTTEIENEGDVSDTQTVDLNVSNLGSDSASVSLNGESDTAETFEVSTGSTDAGDYTAEVSTDNDTARESVSVEGESGQVVEIDHDTQVELNSEFEITVETANSAGTIVSVDPDGFDITLDSDDAVNVEDNQIEFADPAEADSTYTIEVDIEDSSDDDTAEIVAWVNAEDRDEADDEMSSTVTVGENHPSGVTMTVWDAVTDQSGESDELEFDDLVNAIQAYQAEEEINGVELEFQDLIDLIQWYQ